MYGNFSLVLAMIAITNAIFSGDVYECVANCIKADVFLILHYLIARYTMPDDWWL